LRREDQKDQHDQQEQPGEFKNAGKSLVAASEEVAANPPRLPA
jgi:hypothetical protein